MTFPRALAFWWQALRKAAVNKAAKEKFKAEKAAKEVPAPATTAVA